MLTRDRERLRHIRLLHVAKFERYACEVLRQRLDPHAIFFGNARRIGSDNCQHDIMLMQDFVVLQVMQKRGRRKFGVAREKHGRSRNDVRRFFLKATEQCVERNFGTPCLADQNSGSAAPGQN